MRFVREGCLKLQPHDWLGKALLCARTFIFVWVGCLLVCVESRRTRVCLVTVVRDLGSSLEQKTR